MLGRGGGRGDVRHFEMHEHMLCMLLCLGIEEVMHKNLAHIIRQGINARMHTLFPARNFLHLFFHPYNVIKKKGVRPTHKKRQV